MALLQSTGASGLLVPALYRQAHITTPKRAPSTLGQVLRIGRDLLLAVWGSLALAFWLLVIVGFAL